MSAIGGKQQRGIALVTVVLIVALATTAAVAMSTRQQIDIRRTGNVLMIDQADLYMQAIEDWAGWILQRDAAQSNTDALGEQWARLLPPVPVDNGQITGRIIDLQSRYNINNLVRNGKVSDEDVVFFQRLLMLLELDPEIVSAIIDWLDKDIDYTLPAGAEDDAYLERELPYRAANRKMRSVSELRLVAGVDTATYKKLRPYVTALPIPTRMNINTMPAELIMALADGMQADAVERFIEVRGDKGFESLNAALSHEAFAGKQVEDDLLAVNSQWFMVRVEMEIGRIYRRAESTLMRMNNEPAVAVSRSYNLD